MILNNAFIEHMKFDGEEITDTKEFIDRLLAADDLVADVYVNGARVCSGPLSLSVNNNWVIGCVDERMSITNMPGAAANLHILVHQIGHDETDDIILSVESPLSTFIESGDIDTDLYFAVISTVPNCTQRCFVPDSAFRSLGTNNITPANFNALPKDPTVGPTTPAVTYTFEEGDKGYMYAVFTMSGVDYDPEESYSWNVSANGNIFDMSGTGDTARQEFQNLESPEYVALVSGENIEVTVADSQSVTLFAEVTATKAD